MLKYFTKSSAKSYSIKYAVDCVLKNDVSNNSDEIGSSIRKVIHYHTIRNKFASINDDLKVEGITHIEVGDHGLEFIRKNIESPAESNDLMKQKINEFGKAAYMKKDFPKAITIYEKVMEMDTEDVTYWGNLSAVMFELKAWKEV